MGSPLAILRDLLPLKQTAAEKTAAAARGLMASFAGLSADAASSGLTSRVIPLLAEEPNLHLRFKLLEEATKTAEASLKKLESQVMQAVLPLPSEAKAGAIEADNLLKALAASYADIAREINTGHLPELSNLYHHSTLRAISTLARRQFLAYRAYATPSVSSWQVLHELYLMVCNPSATSLNGETALIEHEYLGALLFAYMEPGKLPRTELETTHTCTHQLAAYAAVSDSSLGIGNRDPEACFLVRPDDGNPGYPMTRLPVGKQLSNGLIIDCNQILAALDRNLSRQTGKPVQPVLNVSATLLQNLRIAIAGKSARRFNRTKFRPRADLISGLGPVIKFVNGNSFSRRALDGVGRHESRTLTTEWSLVDEGPDGFLIRFIKGEKSKVGAGDLVALQPRESSKIHICLVRRIASTSGSLELGLQLLSPQVSIVDVTTGRGRNPAIRGIFLHNLPAYGQFSGLIIPPGTLSSGQTISFSTQGQMQHRQIGKCIEANEGLEFVALDPVPD
jgi:cyclic-di-GMP-binding protein